MGNLFSIHVGTQNNCRIETVLEFFKDMFW